MKRFLAFAVLALAGCATGQKPVATYSPEWCELSEFHGTDGTTLYVYTSPQGNVVVARDKDGHLVATASGRQVSASIEEAVKAIEKK